MNLLVQKFEHEHETWRVGSYAVNGKWHVYPKKGLSAVDNWPMGLRFFERLRGGGNYRVMYPKNERQLRRSLALCALYCERRTAAEAWAKETLARVTGVL